MNIRETQSKQKQIEDLTLRELDMVYSLSRIGWSCPEIRRRYGISETDVRKIVEDYGELRKLFERKLTEKGLQRDQEPDLNTKKSRKRRSDAVYATTADRQAAYRARLKEKRYASFEQPL